MLAHPRLKRIAGCAVVVGLAASVQIALPATANAVSPAPNVMRALYGSPGPVNAVISADGRSITISSGTFTGTATVSINGQTFEATMTNGQGVFTFPAGLALGSYTFTVTVGGRTETKTLFVTPYGNVVGVAAYRALLRANGVGANRGGVSGSDSGVDSGDSDDSSATSGSDSSDGGMLPATGAGASSELLGLLGLGLLGAGGASIVIARRRARA